MNPRHAVAAAALCGLAAPAGSATIVRSFDIRAEAFRDISQGIENAPPAGGPFDPIIGRFSFRYDPTVTNLPTSEGLSISGFTLPYIATVRFVYSVTRDALSVGTGVDADGGYGSSGSGGTEFGFSINNVGGTPTGSGFLYDTGFPTPGLWFAPEFPVVAVVPEPTAWMLMIMGFGLAGTMLRRGCRPQTGAIPERS